MAPGRSADVLFYVCIEFLLRCVSPPHVMVQPKVFCWSCAGASYAAFIAAETAGVVIVLRGVQMGKFTVVPFEGEVIDKSAAIII